MPVPARRRLPSEGRNGRKRPADRGEELMPKTKIRSDKLHQPSGVFSHATMIEAKGRLVFISGMTARRLDGTMQGVGNIEVQTRQGCENLKAAGEAGGGAEGGICRGGGSIRK